MGVTVMNHSEIAKLIWGHEIGVDIIEPLSQIIRELNERFGTDFSEEDKVFIRNLEEQLEPDPALVASVKVNAPKNVRPTFNYVVAYRLQDIVDTNFKLYKRITDDKEFSKFLLNWLFERFRKEIAEEEAKAS